MRDIDSNTKNIFFYFSKIKYENAWVDNNFLSLQGH